MIENIEDLLKRLHKACQSAGRTMLILELDGDDSQERRLLPDSLHRLSEALGPRYKIIALPEKAD